ncbi:hypothetical protein [Flagellimonas sp. 2504JD4-2]
MENAIRHQDLFELSIEPTEQNEISLEEFTTQKLRTYIELLKLKNEYPEFKDDIISRLVKFSKTDLLMVDESIEVADFIIQRSGEIEKISDSVNKIKFYVKRNTNQGLFKDSITAYITTSTVNVDGIQRFSRDVVFE